MSYVIARQNGRFTGYYQDAQGKTRSAGTFATEGEAMIRAGDREGSISLAPIKEAATRPLGTYSEFVDYWLQHEEGLSPRTKQGYASNMHKHVLPLIGHLSVEEIRSEVIVAMLSAMRSRKLGASVQAQCKAAIGRSFQSIVPSRVTLNPTHGVRVDIPPSRSFDLLGEDEFRMIVDKLPNAGCTLFAQFLMTSGARFGEANEIRLSDLYTKTGEVFIGRRAVEVHQNGSRFQVLAGTKSGTQHGRTVVLPLTFIQKLEKWARVNHIASHDLLFPKRLLTPWDIDDLLVITPGDSFRRKGKTFHHGTAYGYTGGACRCTDCGDALRLYRRALRRGHLRKRNGERSANTTGHLANDQWRKIWRKATKESGIGWYPRTHDIRHACATHLVASGVSITEVMDRLGHRNIETTLRYQHRVDKMSSKAAESLENFIGGS